MTKTQITTTLHELEALEHAARAVDAEAGELEHQQQQAIAEAHQARQRVEAFSQAGQEPDEAKLRDLTDEADGLESALVERNEAGQEVERHLRYEALIRKAERRRQAAEEQREKDAQAEQARAVRRAQRRAQREKGQRVA